MKGARLSDVCRVVEGGGYRRCLTNWQIVNLAGLILFLACPFLLICRAGPRGRLASPELLTRHIAQQYHD